jgi:glutamyl-tRNA synthetase
MGFLPEAFVNMLAMLGWNDGSSKEILRLKVVRHFSIDRVHKGGAKFDFERRNGLTTNGSSNQQ